MEEDKRPDRVFRENIDPVEMAPPDRVWTRLERQLDAAHAARAGRRRRLVALLALLLVAGSSGLYYLLPERQPVAGLHDGAFTHAEKAAAPKGASVSRGPVADASVSTPPVSGSVSTQPLRVAAPVHQDAITGNGPVAASARTREQATFRPDPVTQQAGTLPAPGTPEATHGSTSSASGTVTQTAVHPSGEENLPFTQDNKTRDGSTSSAVNEEETNGQFTDAVTASPSDDIRVETANMPGTPAGDSTASPQPIAADEPVSDYRSGEKEAGWLRRFGKTLSLELFYGADYCNRRLQVNPSYAGVGATENPSSYNQQESAAYSYSTGLRFRSELSKKWSVSTGIFYSTYNRSVSLGDAYVVSDSIFENAVCPGQTQGNHPVQHHNSNGYYGQPSTGLHYVIHTSSGVVDLTNIPMHEGGRHGPVGPPDCPRDGDTLLFTGKALMQISYINIPLTVRYVVRPGTLSWYTEAGAAVSFMNTNRVEVEFANSESEANEVIGIEHTSYTLMFSAGASLSLGHGWSASLEPALRYSITPVNETSTMKAYPYFIGLRAAVGVHF